MVDLLSWKDAADELEKQVSAAEHLCNDWSALETEHEEAERLLTELETELDDLCADTDAGHLQNSYQQLQVRVKYCDAVRPEPVHQKW